MSTTFDAASAATLLQLVAAGYSIDLRARTMAASWRVSITDADGHNWQGTSRELVAALAAASAAGDDYLPLVQATLDVVKVTEDHADAWRTLAAIASEFDYVTVRPGQAPHHVLVACNAGELGVVEIAGILPEENPCDGFALCGLLNKLDDACKLPEPPPVRGHTLAPIAGAFET